MVNVFISTFLNSTKVSGAAEIAILMFESICDPKSLHKPDIVTANIMLKHYVARGDIEAMSSVMAKLSSLKLKPDVFTYTTVVEGLLKSGRREVARDTLDLMESTGIAPSPHTYGLLIGDLARAGTREDMARAEALVKRMRQAKLTPSTITYTALLGGYYRAGMAAQGSAILRQMEKDGVDMNRVTYNMILRSILTSKEDAPSSTRALKQAGDRAGTTEAWRSIINAMLSRGIVPNDDTWYILFSGLHRARRSRECHRRNEATGIPPRCRYCLKQADHSNPAEKVGQTRHPVGKDSMMYDVQGCCYIINLIVLSRPKCRFLSECKRDRKGPFESSPSQ
jgi:pentatricopeptide repeat protein